MTAPPVPTFKLRRGRVTPTQREALVRLWPRFGVAVDGTSLDLVGIFGRRAPVVLEIGFGMGETTYQMAVAAPERDVLAVDVHTPGIGSLLKHIGGHGLTNVRVADGDALVVLRHMLPDDSLSEVRVFFPDPWPKTKHAKRRLVTPSFCDLVSRCLRSGGMLHVATDSLPYAAATGQILAAHSEFCVRPIDETPWRPTTRFERQALDAGRSTYDVVARRH